MTSASLKTLLNRRALKEWAGEPSFSKGEEYQASGQVGSITEHGDMIVAEVSGTSDYRVKLWVKGGHLDYACNCPVGEEGDFCKHCVAAGLEWLARPKKDDGPRKTAGKRPVTMDEAREFLAEQDKSSLVDMLLEQSMRDDLLRERIFKQTATSRRKSAAHKSKHLSRR
jgi:uncharacterized Zn finger protein